MIRIAICDDNVKDLRLIAKLIAEYGKSHYAEEIEVEPFSRPADLVRKIQAGECFHIYILDILMPQKNGIELGRLVRERQDGAVIVYTTSSKDFAFDAFGVLAQRYLVKPIDRHAFFEALDFACAQSTSKKNRIFPFKTAAGIMSIPFSTILYAECSSRMIHLICVDDAVFDSVYIRRNFETEIYPLLESGAFVQTHKSYAVNLEHVEQYRTESFVMDNGATIPIARKRQAEVKRGYLKFLAEYDR